MKVHAKVRFTPRSKLGSSSKEWPIETIGKYIHARLLDGHTVYVHSSDGEFAAFYPKCKVCGCYNTIAPIVDGLCESCVS